MGPDQVGRMRAAAESRMLDSCTIRAAAGRGALNETSGKYPPAAGVVAYVGRCLVKFGATQPRDVDVAGKERTLQQVEVHVPIDGTGGIERDAVIVIDAVDPERSDPDLVGRRFRITGRFHQTHAAKRIFPVEEVS